MADASTVAEAIAALMDCKMREFNLRRQGLAWSNAAADTREAVAALAAALAAGVKGPEHG